MFNWKALSKSELKRELEAFKRKDLKALRALMNEIEEEQECACIMYVDAEEGSEEEEKWNRIWNKINDKWEVVRSRIDKLEKGRDNEPEPIRADRG